MKDVYALFIALPVLYYILLYGQVVVSWALFSILSHLISILVSKVSHEKSEARYS